MIAKKLISAIFLLTLLSACTFTGLRSDFSQIQLSNNIYKISVTGKTYISHETVKNYALYLAAKLTLRNNKQRFIIIKDEIERLNEITTSAPIIIGSTEINGHVQPIFSNPQTKTSTYSSGSIIIEMIDKNDKRYKNAYDADLIIKQLNLVLSQDDIELLSS